MIVLGIVNLEYEDIRTGDADDGADDGRTTDEEKDDDDNGGRILLGKHNILILYILGMKYYWKDTMSRWQYTQSAREHQTLKLNCLFKQYE